MDSFIFLYWIFNIFAALLVLMHAFYHLFSYFPIINQIELQKDYVSKPIFSILPQSPTTSFSVKSLLFNDSLISFKINTKNACKQSGRELFTNTTIDSFNLSFTYYDSTYESLLESSVKKGEQCPTNYKQCGILDTLDNIMCIKEDLECPINMLIMDDNQEPPNEYKDKYTFTNVKLNTTYLHYTNEAIDNYILAKFIHRIVRGYELSPFIEKENENLNDFVLIDCRLTELNMSYFPIYHSIYSNKTSNNEYFFRSFIGLKPNCVPNDFYSEEKVLIDYDNFKQMKMIWQIMCLVYILNTIAYLFVKFGMSKYNSKKRPLKMLFNITNFLSLIPMFVFNYFTILSSKRLRYENSCYDEYTNSLIEVEMKDTFYDYVIRIISLVLNAVLIIFAFILIIKLCRKYSFCRKNKKTERLNEDKEIEAQSIK